MLIQNNIAKIIIIRNIADCSHNWLKACCSNDKAAQKKEMCWEKKVTFIR